MALTAKITSTGATKSSGTQNATKTLDSFNVKAANIPVELSGRMASSKNVNDALQILDTRTAAQSSTPSPMTEGDIWYKTDTDNLYIRDENSWNEVVVSGVAGTIYGGTDTTPLNTNTVRRSAYNASTVPANNTLIAGELNFIQGSKKLYIGRENDGSGTIEAYHIPLATDLVPNSTSFTLTDNSGNANDNSQVLALASGVAGDGLTLSSHALAVNPDNDSIELNSDALRIKPSKVLMNVSDGSSSTGITLGNTATFAGTANETTVAESSGTITIGLPDNITIQGNLTVGGTTTTVNSTTVTIDDPVFTLGGDTNPSSDDNKDRGIEFKWHNGSSAKLGFFGMDDSDGKFKFIPDATNSSEVFSGSVGSAVFNDVVASTINGGAIFDSNSTIDGGSF